MSDRKSRGLAAGPGAARSALAVTPSEHEQLEAWVRAGKTPQRVARRCRIVMLAAQGHSTREIVRRLGTAQQTVRLWRQRFLEFGLPALWRDAPGRGRKPTVGENALERLRELLKHPPEGAERWTVRMLAETTGLSRSTVHRALRRTR